MLPKIRTGITAEKCREHARSFREKLAQETDPDQRRKLDELARSWEDLCAELETTSQV